jgi:hypothetical protein
MPGGHVRQSGCSPPTTKITHPHRDTDNQMQSGRQNTNRGHEGEPDAHLPAAYSDLWHAMPSSVDWAPAHLTEA